MKRNAIVLAAILATVGAGEEHDRLSVWLCQTAAIPAPAPVAAITPQCATPGGTVTGTLTAANVIGPAAQGIEPGQFSELVAAIRAGATYVNVHSSKWGGGEIRSQLTHEGH
jgi:hypothetical protein